MERLTVERSIWIDAPRERVWQALTDPEQVRQWLAPNVPGAQLQRDGRGKLTLHLGPVSVDFAQLEAVDPPRQVTSRGLPERLITTSYSLEEEQGGTRVTVTMAGFEALAAQAREDRLRLSSTGWEETLQNLKSFVAGTELPFPQAFVGPLFGYWRETRNTLALERSIWISAPRERVWRAITDPKQIQQWFSPTTPWELSALEVGGRFYVYNAETGTEMYVQLIELLNPPHRLVTRSVAEQPEDVVKGTTYILEEESGGTRLTLTFAGYEQQPEATRWSDLERDTFGFGMMLQNAKAYVEGQRLPYPGGF